eukprot:TRINITY_DN49743_c0_g1_i1.p1 TRINITY_DN49743_c0_g1~~TRINITY_DN49743_c0_g1_i1.p1  ORF type:complete len:110 (-),score=21.09 TRINITY_DN49743_c0_g1_i1:51-380(-)
MRLQQFLDSAGQGYKEVAEQVWPGPPPPAPLPPRPKPRTPKELFRLRDCDALGHNCDVSDNWGGPNEQRWEASRDPYLSSQVPPPEAMVFLPLLQRHGASPHVRAAAFL